MDEHIQFAVNEIATENLDVLRPGETYRIVEREVENIGHEVGFWRVTLTLERIAGIEEVA